MKKVRKIFVCYNVDDKKYFNKIRRWKKRKSMGDHAIILSTMEEKGKRGMQDKRQLFALKRKLMSADFAIIIIGENNRRHPWIELERLAKRNNIERYYMRIPYTQDKLPYQLKDMEQMAFNPNAIEKKLRLLEEESDEQQDKNVNFNLSSKSESRERFS